VAYQWFAAAWPTMPETGGVGERMNGIPKYVASTTLAEVGWHNARLITGSVADAVAALKREPGQDILVGGSADLVNSLMPHELIDDDRLMLHSVVVDHGKRLFAEGNETKTLELVETTPLGPSVVVLTYRPAGR